MPQLSAGVRPSQRDPMRGAFLFLLRSNRLGALIGDAIGGSVLLWLRLLVPNYGRCLGASISEVVMVTPLD